MNSRVITPITVSSSNDSMAHFREPETITYKKVFLVSYRNELSQKLGADQILSKVLVTLK